MALRTQVVGLDTTSPVDSVMQRWPETIGVFIAHRMGCVGCPIGRFHTVEDACREHGLDHARLFRDLRAAAGGDAALAREGERAA